MIGETSDSLTDSRESVLGHINSRVDVLLDLRKIISNLRRLNWTGIDDD